jgi:hypothetical protein
MIELFLNPDQDGAWEETGAGDGGEGPGAGNNPSSTTRAIDEAVADNIAAARTLLKELKPIAK